MSAWIEINKEMEEFKGIAVALLVSAWIEISALGGQSRDRSRRTPRECVD